MPEEFDRLARHSADTASGHMTRTPTCRSRAVGKRSVLARIMLIWGGQLLMVRHASVGLDACRSPRWMPTRTCLRLAASR